MLSQIPVKATSDKITVLQFRRKHIFKFISNCVRQLRKLILILNSARRVVDWFSEQFLWNRVFGMLL